MWFLISLLCSWLALSGGQSTNATLSNIDLIPCGGIIHEGVSLFKSDIYTVQNNVSLCRGSWAPNKTNGFRVLTHAGDGAEKFQHTPVVFVARQEQDGIVSWTIPLQPYGFSTLFYQVNRTVCPISSDALGSAPLLYIDVFSSSPEPINYTISIEAVDGFEVTPDGEEIDLLIGATASQILYVKFPEDVEVLTVEAHTVDNKCAFISIQNNSCPVNDLLNTARSLGIFQTMSLTAFLTVKAGEVNDREFLIIVITTNYSVCHGSEYLPLINIGGGNGQYEQNMTLRVKPLPPPSTFAMAIALPLLVFGGVWVVGLIIPFFCCPQILWIPLFKCKCGSSFKCSCFKRDKEEQLLSEDSPKENYSSTQGQSNSTALNQKAGNPSSDSGDEWNDQKPYAESLEISAKVEADESKLKLPRMCKQSQTKMDKRYYVYGWNTVTVGIFYALPAFQLVLSEQQILNLSGNQDQCYYNFKCAYPVWVFSAFNNIWSNIGYVLQGILFIVVVFIRQVQYKRRREKDEHYVDSHGVPQFFGIYFAMGIALVTEGFMSAFYHICPTNANFQFDTAFMFIIGGLFLVKMFQNRHPDIHANAFIAFFSFAIIIFFTLLGIYFDRANPVVVRVVIFLLVLGLVLYFFTSFYHFHELNFGRKSIMNKCRNLKSYFTTCPMHKGRFFKLLIGFGLNAILVILVIALHNSVDLATSVLAFFLVNLIYFIVLYTLQKLYYREPITILPLILPPLLAILWGSAFWFFFHSVSNWKYTPAESRALNRECIILGFYDNHDVWHFLSSSAMFFSFLFMLVLDDGVVNVKRKDLHIF